MIDYETYVRIRNYHQREGLNYSQIAQHLSLDHRTVAKWANAERFTPCRRSKRPGKLDSFKNTIVRMLEKYPYSAAQIFQHIQTDGYEGGYSIVKDYIRKVRPPKTKAYLKLWFAPAECAQVDWGSFGTVPVGSTTRRLSFFVMVLCYSRMIYVRFTVLETMEHFLDCHQQAFQFFGGTPRKIMVDNLKSAVLKRLIGQAPTLNPRYLDFADCYGFTIVPCAVGKGNEKGRVESGVGYVKKNLLAGLEISDFKILQPLADHWRDTVANVRLHGVTGQKPIDLFAEEKSLLRPLPVAPYDVAVIKPARVSKQFRVTVDTNHYSVPAQLAGVRVIVKLYPDRICIYHEDKLVARHVRSYDRRKDYEHPDHPKILLEQRKKARDQKLFMRFISLSDQAQEYYRQLALCRMNPLHHIRKIVALSEIYPIEQMQRAIADAFTLQAFSCEYIANLLEQRARPIKKPGALHLTRRSELLELTLSRPDIDIYNHSCEEKDNDTPGD